MTAQPSTYWTGRFSSINDRLSNEELSTHFTGSLPSSPSTCWDAPSPKPSTWLTKTDSDKFHTTDAVLTRMRTALETIYDLCATEDARRSFLIWQVQLANTLQIPELSRPIKPARLPAAFGTCDVGLGLDGSPMMVDRFGQHVGTPTGKKAGIVGRLLGKARRRSAALEGYG
jgi:hypothetical protein